MNNAIFAAALGVGVALSLTTGALAQSSGESDQMRALTDNVLSGLGVQTNSGASGASASDTPPVTEENAKMRNLTNNVLAGLGVQGGETATPSQDEGLSTLVGRALAEGQSDAYIQSLLDEAVQTGEVQVPSSLRRASGQADTGTLVALLRAEARVAEARANASAGGGAANVEVPFPFVAEMPLTQSRGKMFYRIQPDDTLTLIALRAYGDAAYFPQLFDANTDRLTSPDRIFVGQRLYVPDLR